MNGSRRIHNIISTALLHCGSEAVGDVKRRTGTASDNTHALSEPRLNRRDKQRNVDTRNKPDQDSIADEFRNYQ
jgi:hypothetical protein